MNKFAMFVFAAALAAASAGCATETDRVEAGGDSAHVVEASTETRRSTGISYYTFDEAGAVALHAADGSLVGTVRSATTASGVSVVIAVGASSMTVDYTVRREDDGTRVVSGTQDGVPFSLRIDAEGRLLDRHGAEHALTPSASVAAAVGADFRTLAVAHGMGACFAGGALIGFGAVSANFELVAVGIWALDDC